MTIYIGNLSFDAEIEDIVGVFSSYGEVTNCKLPLERETGRKRGFAFVDKLLYVNCKILIITTVFCSSY